jgi:GNAT superfamily N-acetyltransferase
MLREQSGYTPEEATKFEAEPSSKTLELLRERGGLEEVDGKQVFDPEVIQSLLRRDPERKWKKPPVKVDDVIENLRGLKGYRKSDLDNQEFISGHMAPRDVMPLPGDLKSLAHDYPQAAEKAIINVYDLEPRATRWNRKIKLDSGEEVSTAELFIAAQLQGPLKARRDTGGKLEVFDSEQNNHVPFSFNGFERLVKRRVQVTNPKGQREDFRGGSHFVGQYTPNLVKVGLLHQRDFRTRTGSKSTEVHRVHERRVNPKAPTVNIGNETGSVKYYIGRDKLVGTEIPTTSIVVTQLDPSTAGVIEDQHGRQQLIYTFDLLGPEETRERRSQVLAKNPNLSPSEISARTVVNATDMRSRMKAYDITEVIPQRADEPAKEYGKRVSDLSDFDFVARKFEGFFAEAGIGVHNLPWSEQLILANAIGQERDRERLITFVKNYGIEGLRSFLSLDYDSKMASVILGLGEQSPQVAKITFKKYSEIVDATRQVHQFIEQSFHGDAEYSPKTINAIKENLLRKAKELLATYYKQVQTGSDLDLDKATKDLNNLKTGVLLYGATFKELRRAGNQVELEDFAGAEIEVAEGLQPDDIPQMRKIYAKNYAHVPEFQKELLETFDRITSKEQAYGYGDGDNTYYLLKVDGKIRAFNRFHTLGEDREGITHTEFGFFNVDPDYQGFQIGEAMMEKSLDLEAKAHVIEATCNATDNIATRYIARGFVGVDFVTGNEGMAHMSIQRDDTRNKHLASKSMPRSEILKKSDLGENIKVSRGEKPQDLPFDLINSGWILTQYFMEEGKYCAVFERRDEEDVS